MLRYPSPQPLSRWERGFALPFSLREKVPEGRMRGNGASTPELAVHHCAAGSILDASLPLTPTPLPRGEGLLLLLFPSPSGELRKCRAEKVPEGRMRGNGASTHELAVHHCTAGLALELRYPSPQPLSRWKRGSGCDASMTERRHPLPRVRFAYPGYESR